MILAFLKEREKKEEEEIAYCLILLRPFDKHLVHNDITNTNQKLKHHLKIKHKEVDPKETIKMTKKKEKVEKKKYETLVGQHEYSRSNDHWL